MLTLAAATWHLAIVCGTWPLCVTEPVTGLTLTERERERELEREREEEDREKRERER